MIRVRGIPLYWAFEEDPQDRAILTGSWVVEDSIPFRASTYGVRIRVSQHHWLHVGLFRYRREALHLGLAYRPTQIGRWGKDAETETDGIPTEAVTFDFARLARLPTPDLELLLESSLSRTAELFRGITHKELDPAWLLKEMETQVTQALDAIQVLQERVEK